jgi:hypothetical protein
MRRRVVLLPPAPELTAELWYAPEPNRDLVWGVGGAHLAPDPNVTYKMFKQKIEEGLALGR